MKTKKQTKEVVTKNPKTEKVKQAKEVTKNPKKVKQAKEVTKNPKKDKVIKEVAKQQKTSIVEKVISKQREVKYIYPDDVKDSLSKKTWRQKTRNEIHRLEQAVSRIQDTNSKEYKKALKELNNFKKSVLKSA